MLELTINRRKNGAAYLALKEPGTQRVIAERTTCSQEDTDIVEAWFREFSRVRAPEFFKQKVFGRPSTSRKSQ